MSAISNWRPVHEVTARDRLGMTREEVLSALLDVRPGTRVTATVGADGRLLKLSWKDSD